MKKTIIVLFVLLISVTAWGQENIKAPPSVEISNAHDINPDDASKLEPGSIEVRIPLYLTAPLTVWAGGLEYYGKFNNDIAPGRYTGTLNCMHRKQRQDVDLLMDDGRVFLYCKPIPVEEEE